MANDDPDFVPGFPTNAPQLGEGAVPKPAPVGDPPVDDQEPSDDTGPDEDGQDEGEQEDAVLETIEVEIGGKTYVVPKAVEEHLLREEDYTQKTQSLAEQRKQVETFQQQLQERATLQEAIMDDAAQVKGLEAQLAEYQKIDWPAYYLQDPRSAQYHKMQMEQIQGFHGQAVEALRGKMQQVSELQSRAKEETIQRTITALEKPDPTYSWPGYSAKHMDQLDADAAKIFGLTEQERSRITSPKSIKILHAAVSYVKSLQKAAAANPKPTLEPKPVRQAPSNRARTSPSLSGDELPVEKWVERERKRQAAMNGARG